MLETLSSQLQQAGAWAPILYISFFLLAALVPAIPTPLISALGGSLLGFVPAMLYGMVGLGLGALLALNLSRRLGRPVVIRIFGSKTWEDWEMLLGVRSPLLWGAIFFTINTDLVVMAAGLSGLALWKLWLTAFIARLPWIVAAAWFGDLVLISDEYLLLGLLIGLAALVIINATRARLQQLLIRRQLKHDDTANSSQTQQHATVEADSRKRAARLGPDNHPP
ncbi:MAG: TVP38/TMEM64 family protein [Truepera sp.]|nr:TVP38/TMEM64 family protein [Truepera sp.]